MKTFISIGGVEIPLTESQTEQIRAAFATEPRRRIADVQVGEIFKIDCYEFVVLEQMPGQTAVILKDVLEETSFGYSNRLPGSKVGEICCEFAEAVADLVGYDGIVEHEVDLTADDGLKDYGSAQRLASPLTAEQYRKYVDVLDCHNPKVWWWLATPLSTDTHNCDKYVKCVSPSGYLYGNHCYDDDFGVRPFLIFKSNIFVSG